MKNIFVKTKNNKDVKIKLKENDIKKEKKEEWIWVEGYKGFNNDLTCNDYQYEVGTVHKFEGDVNLCHSGFHFCRDLKDVDGYYQFENFNNRFFKVKGLVKKTEYEKYGEVNPEDILGVYILDKLVAKEIELMEEVDYKEIYGFLKGNDFESLEEYIYAKNNFNNIKEFTKSKQRKQLDEVMTGCSELYKELVFERLVSEKPTFNIVGSMLKRLHSWDDCINKIKAFVSMDLSNDMLVYHIEKMFNK
jgi:hypothetical protein